MCEFCERKQNVVGWNQPPLEGIKGDIVEELEIEAFIHDYQTTTPELIIKSSNFFPLLTGTNGIATINIPIERCPLCGRKLGRKTCEKEKYNIAIPVPLGTTLYRIHTKCDDQCFRQKEHFDSIWPPTKEGRCGKEMPCHTRKNGIQEFTFTLKNIEWVLNEYGKWVFPSRVEAEIGQEKIIEINKKRMQELGFGDK